ncbi:MAG: hypothetical protein K2O24_00685 [Muribaculaceae bacterium]|nr:hypothetical protein [Muribaculaceae bacterium]
MTINSCPQGENDAYTAGGLGLKAADTPRDLFVRLLPEFSRMAATKSAASERSYNKAIRALREYIAASGEGETMERFLSGWMLDMYLRGLSAKSSALFFDIISGLYTSAVREGLAQSTDAFRRVKRLAGELTADSKSLSRGDCDAVTTLARSAASRPGRSPRLAPDLLLLSLLEGGADPAKLLGLRRTDVERMGEAASSIAERYSSTRRQYVFDLSPRPATETGLRKRANAILSPLLASAGVTSRIAPAALLAGVWAVAALRCGISPEDVLAVAPDARGALPLSGLFPPAAIDETRKRRLVETVTPMFASDTLRWYAMRLRPRVDYDDLSERLRFLKDDLPVPQLFYPSEEIARRTGKRLTFETRPVIRDVVFFRSRPADIHTLFSRIGDLAWCYTTTGRPGAPYAPISHRAFERFQAAVGTFTPEYEVAPLGTLVPRPGESVVMVGTLFQGQEASVDHVALKEGEPAIYRLRFQSDNGIEWRVRTNQFVKPKP